MRDLWNDGIPFPALDEMKTVDGIQYRTVHAAEADHYHFLLGAAIGI